MTKTENTLFGDEAPKPIGKKLALTKQPRRPLTKAQQFFNRLVKSIERLRVRLHDESIRLDKTMEAFETKVHPRRMQLVGGRKDLVRSLSVYIESGHLKKKDREILSELISAQLDEIAHMEGALPEEFKEVFEKVNGVSIDEAAQNDLESTRMEMKEMFDAIGVEVDLSGLKADMTPQEMEAETARIAAKLAAESQRRLEEEAEPGRRKKKASKKQEEAMATAKLAEEVRKKSISKIYRDLARVLHPDLEPDESIRPQKAALMAKLATAYHNNDLHTLLMLELEWMEREEGNLELLTEEKLTIYNHVLKEQAADLESQLEELPMHPRYQPIVEDHGPFGYRVISIENELERLGLIIESVNTTLSRLRSKDAIGEVRLITKNYRAAVRARRG